MSKTVLFALTTSAIAITAHAESWDMPTPYSETTFHTVNIQQFADEVSAATSGALNITVHSGGSLFPGAEIKNAVRSGQVYIGEFLLSTLSNEDAVYGLDAQPFVATSYAQAEQLWAAQKPTIVTLLADHDLMPLFSVPWPAQSLYTKAPIASVADLAGKRLRAYNAALEEFAQLADMAAVQVEAADIPQAFSTGQVDAMITSPSTGASSQAWDFVDYYTAIDAWLPKNIVVVNKSAFEALPADVQAAVLTAAANAETRGWELSSQETATKVAELEAGGMSVVAPSEELKSGLADIGETMVENWKQSASAQALAVYLAYLNQ